MRRGVIRIHPQYLLVVDDGVRWLPYFLQADRHAKVRLNMVLFRVQNYFVMLQSLL